jgi:hypothetical protein
MAKVVNLVTNVVPPGTELPPTVLDGNYILAGAAKTLTVADNRAVVKLNHATASVVRLPAATGAGTKFLVVVTVVGSGAHSVAVNASPGTDIIQGVVSCLDSNLATVNNFAFAAGATADTVTLTPATTGGTSVGEWLEFEDISSGVWLVRGQLSAPAPATPFSAAVP